MKFKKYILACLTVGGLCLLTPSCSDYLDEKTMESFRKLKCFLAILK